MDITEFLKREISQNYKVSGKLGAGGCSIVYDAIRLSDNRRVAIKLLSLPETLSPEEADGAKRRFCREALLMVILHNPHVVECLDYGVFNGSPCIVLDFIHGKPLDIYVREFGALPFKLTVNIICQVLDALECAHAAGVIHRDIKPGNILLTGEGDNPIVHLIDFGIASMMEGPETDRMSTKMGSIRGTPSYMAPELFTGFASASPVSDLYAVGLVLLECLTGTVAVNGVTMMEIAFKQTHQELVIPLFIPKCLSNVILKSCAKIPDMRYQTAREMSDALKAALPEAEAKKESYELAYLSGATDIIEDEDAEKKDESETAEAEKPQKKGIGIIIAALVAGMAIAAAVVFFIMSRQDTNQSPVENPPTQNAATVQENQPVPENTGVVPNAPENNNTAETQQQEPTPTPSADPAQAVDVVEENQAEPSPDGTETQPTPPEVQIAEPEPQPVAVPTQTNKAQKKNNKKKQDTKKEETPAQTEQVKDNSKKNNNMIIPSNLIWSN